MPSIDVAGSRVEYLEAGAGEPLVLLHSSGGSGAQWRALAERLSARYRILAPDLYGYGATAPWPGRGPLALAHEAQIVDALLARAGAPAHLVGHSYGGAVALHVARESGALLRSLALVEPVAFHLLRGRDAPALAEITSVAGRVAASVACGDYLGGFADFVDYWSGAGAWDAIPAEKRGALAARLTKVALDFHATLNEPTQLEHLAMTAVPTLLVRGARSPRPTRRICELLAGVLPESRLETVDGAGHMLPLTHREEVNTLIAIHLEENSGRSSRRPEAKQALAETLHQEEIPCQPCHRPMPASATRNAWKCPSASAGTSTATSSADVNSTMPRSSCPTGFPKPASSVS